MMRSGVTVAERDRNGIRAILHPADEKKPASRDELTPQSWTGLG